MGESLQTPPIQLPDTDPLPCPHCGYDLRASLADHCSECGHAIDRATLGVTSFPWSARHDIRNYLKTIWLITINSRRLKFETWKNQNLAHARSFQRITIFIAAITLAATFAAIVTADPVAFAISRPPPKPATWRDDLVVPWAAGATLRAVIPTMLLLLAIHLTKIHHRLFRLKFAPAHLQDRASAIACYASAPLAWLLPLAILWAGNLGLIITGIIRSDSLFISPSHPPMDPAGAQLRMGTFSPHRPPSPRPMAFLLSFLSWNSPLVHRPDLACHRQLSLTHPPPQISSDLPRPAPLP